MIIWPWMHVNPLASRSFTCGFCGQYVASNQGYYTEPETSRHRPDSGQRLIHLCHHCQCPTFFDERQRQHPGPAYGVEVQHVSDETTREIYTEARRCFAAGAYTGVILCCRKLLMHVAVSQGAQKGLTFNKYIDFLVERQFIPATTRTWVEKIREQGNLATHEVHLSSPAEARMIIDFCGMLLKIAFEFPALAAGDSA